MVVGPYACWYVPRAGSLAWLVPQPSPPELVRSSAVARFTDAVIPRFVFGGVDAWRDDVVVVSPRAPRGYPFARRVMAVRRAHRRAIYRRCNWATVINCCEARLCYTRSTQRMHDSFDNAQVGTGWVTS